LTNIIHLTTAEKEEKSDTNDMHHVLHLALLLSQTM